MADKLLIVALDVTNVKRIKAVHIEPSGNAVILGGRNGQGKSSVLDAIMAALAGKSAIPSVPLRAGEKRGAVKVDLGDVVVTRTFTEGGGGALTVEAKIGDARTVVKAPQAWLDERIGTLAFDPLAFLTLKGQKQADMLRDLVGLDTIELDTRRRAAFEARTEKNREARAALTTAGGMPYYPDAPAEPLKLDQYTVDVQTAAEQKASADAAARKARLEFEPKERAFDDWVVAGRAEMERAILAIDAADAEVARLKDELAKAEVAAEQKRLDKLKRRDELNAESRERKAALAAERSAVEALETAATALPVVDLAAVADRMEKITEVNRKIEANADRAEAFTRAEALEREAAALTAKIAECDRDREAALKAAKFPVDGLGIDADGQVTFNGIPLDQASQAEKIRVSMAVALALNPSLPVVLIRDASLLDQESLALVVDMAEAAGAQVWLERVGDRDPGAVIIEDGAVLGVAE